MNKNITILSITLIILLSFSQIIYADNNIKIYINNKLLELDQQPIIENGRTLVPVRAISESFGMNTLWIQEKATAIIDKPDGSKITIVINSNIATVSDKSVELDAPARSINGRTMVPLRFIGEALGASIIWNQDSHSIYINTTSSNSPNNVMSNLNTDPELNSIESQITQAQFLYDAAESKYQQLLDEHPSYVIIGEVIESDSDYIIVYGSAIGDGLGLGKGYIKIFHPLDSGSLLNTYNGIHYFVKREKDINYESISVFDNGPSELISAKETLDKAKRDLEVLNEQKKSLIEKKNGIRDIKYDNGDHYKGAVNSTGQPNGNGNYIWINGDTYEGEWLDGKFNGNGKLNYENGDEYEGGFKNGLYNGQGKLLIGYHSGISGYDGYYNYEYDGEFKDGKYDGKGTLKHTPELADYIGETDFPYTYIGDFKNGTFHGNGTLYDNRDNQIAYEGLFADGAPIDKSSESTSNKSSSTYGDNIFAITYPTIWGTPTVIYKDDSHSTVQFYKDANLTITAYSEFYSSSEDDFLVEHGFYDNNSEKQKLNSGRNICIRNYDINSTKTIDIAVLGEDKGIIFVINITDSSNSSYEPIINELYEMLECIDLNAG